jgi:hypothetical protein
MTFLDLAVAAFERVKNNPPHLIHVPQDYYTYINSPDWTERKRRYFSIRKYSAPSALPEETSTSITFATQIGAMSPTAI